jgi:hypothetical protein
VPLQNVCGFGFDGKEVILKPLKILLMSFTAILLLSSIGSAGDFDWMKDFNIQAEVDPSGLRARLQGRFQIGDVEVRAVLDSTDNPADAYMLLRLGELSRQPIDRVIREYRAEKGRGWGVLAKSLGIKPGSQEFHALKRGQDLYDHGNDHRSRDKEKEHGRSHSRGRGRR